MTVPEEAIEAAMRQLWEVMKIIVEPSGAVPYAAIAAGSSSFAVSASDSFSPAATSIWIPCRG